MGRGTVYHWKLTNGLSKGSRRTVILHTNTRLFHALARESVPPRTSWRARTMPRSWVPHSCGCNLLSSPSMKLFYPNCVLTTNVPFLCSRSNLSAFPKAFPTQLSHDTPGKQAPTVCEVMPHPQASLRQRQAHGRYRLETC